MHENIPKSTNIQIQLFELEVKTTTKTNKFKFCIRETGWKQKRKLIGNPVSNLLGGG